MIAQSSPDETICVGEENLTDLIAGVVLLFEVAKTSEDIFHTRREPSKFPDSILSCPGAKPAFSIQFPAPDVDDNTSTELTHASCSKEAR